MTKQPHPAGNHGK